ncbi:MAG: hypothetical protein NTY37_01205 [Methanothrix sp.]|nr:hypothetical protein [Methanothrix sp.]
MNTQNGTSETGCCPRFNPEAWDEKEITWTEKLFVKDKVHSFLHIPLNFGQVMKKNMEKIEKAGASAKETIVLSDEKSMWRSDLYIAVEKDFEGSDAVKISGTFLTKVFEGPYKDMGKWMRDMNSFVTSKEKTTKKMYLFYTTCPKCAKVYGKNYVVILDEV